MAVARAYAYLIHPGKGAAATSSITGRALDLTGGSLFNMLNELFGAEPTPQDFEVTFNPLPDGTQENECRNLFIAFQQSATVENGFEIAKRLQKVTDNRSGIGLLFLMAGQHGLKQRVVASRFPTDQAILAEVAAGKLAVEFLEQVFIKRLSAYKALLLDHATPKDGYWKGVATDRQAGRSGEHISEYWLRDFLNADFTETPAHGTRRLATVLKAAVKLNPNLQVKGEIASASTLATNSFTGKSLSIDGFCKHFGFSQDTVQSIKSQLPKESLFTKMFKFDPAEFKQINPYRTVELNTGAILTAPNEDFDTVFATDQISDGQTEFRTSGRINDQRLARK